MLSKKVEQALNDQVKMEGNSSNYYLALACWADMNGFSGVAGFMYKQSDEERFHMLKLMKYLIERDGEAVVPAYDQPSVNVNSAEGVFQDLYKHEVSVTESINKLVGICLSENDYTTHNFLQWYVSEQLEEEATAKTILDKIKLMGDDKSAWYHFDRDIAGITVTSIADPSQGAA
jgi:ferritin